MSTGRIVLYIAASVDGFIADEDGGIEWLDAFERETEDSAVGDAYEEFFGSVDCLVVGATTYEQILTFDEWPYEDRPTYVLTHRDLPRATDAVAFVDGDVGTLAADLRRDHEHIWVVGGAQVAREFLDESQIDELRLSLVPVLLGDGISLFAADGEHHRLALLDTVADSSGIVELRYRVSA